MTDLLSDFEWETVKGVPYATASVVVDTPTTSGTTSGVFDARGLHVLQADIVTTADEETQVQFEVAGRQETTEDEWQPVLGGRFKQTEGDTTPRARPVKFNQIFPFIRVHVSALGSNASSGSVTVRFRGWR